MARSYKGFYIPQNPEKYGGNVKNIIYRSSWELKFFNYCDLNPNIIFWQSEEFFIPYRSPIDNKMHRYFPDGFIKLKKSDGTIKEYLIEIKPKKQTIMPEKNPKRKTKYWINEVKEWGKNTAKWEAAKEFCLDRNWEFMVLTEEHLFS